MPPHETPGRKRRLPEYLGPRCRRHRHHARVLQPAFGRDRV